MNSFLNRFNNTIKTSSADKKWNLVVYKSPEPKIVSIIKQIIKLISSIKIFYVPFLEYIGA